MNLKFNKKRKIIILISVIFIIALLIIIYMVFFKTKDVIKFNNNYESIEYGESIDYHKLIESVNPKEAKIIYPNIEVKEVGMYHLTFTYKIKDEVGKQNIDIIVKDTKTPKVKLRNKKDVEVIVNTQYDIFANINEYDNLSEEAKINRKQVSLDEYKKLKKNIKKQNNLISEREISSKKDIKDSDIINNCILYTTDFNIALEGEYNVKMLFIDENWNTIEKDWNIKVVPTGQIVNSGGTVYCEYPNDHLQTNEAYTTDYSETYIYDENKLVSSLKFITKMTFKEDYDTNENINTLVNAINNKYEKYQEYNGVTVEVVPSSNNVTTNILIDFNLYDLKEDPLGILEIKNSGKVKIEKIIKNLENKATCQLN